MADADKLARNREMWDERVPIHVASRFYDVEGFRAGRNALEPFEVDEVGPVDGLDLVHLQCHFGLDSLSFARLGARVVGVDFSAPAVAEATALATELGLDASFVCSDVYQAAAAVDGRQFDVVFTGLGAINWLPDLDRWSGVVDALLRPGGVFYLAEFHPVTNLFGYEDLDVARSYFASPDGERDDDPGTYTDPGAVTLHNESWEWSHPFTEVLTPLLDRGLVLELFHEFAHTLYARWPFLERHDDGTYHMPADRPPVPLLYSIRMRKPA
jgi:SAM-dependent methyltransferase